MIDDWRASAGTGCEKPKSPIGAEIARPLVGEHQRHPVDDQRLDDARDEALAEADDVEVAVEIAREADQRAPVVVAVAIEHAIERVLHRVLHRPGQQHDDQRGQRGDDPVVRVGVAGKENRDQLHEREVQHDRRRQERRVRQAALDDHFDVAQAIPHDRRREGERHQPSGIAVS